MISNVYSYYLSHYGNKYNSKYESHTKAQLKTMSGKVMKINSQTPAYKLDTSEDAQKYAIDLKENARELVIIANDLTDKDGSINYRKAASSSDPEAVEAAYIGSPDDDSIEALDINVSELPLTRLISAIFLLLIQNISKPEIIPLMLILAILHTRLNLMLIKKNRQKIYRIRYQDFLIIPILVLIVRLLPIVPATQHYQSDLILPV